jgi:chromosome segregation ATPase
MRTSNPFMHEDEMVRLWQHLGDQLIYGPAQTNARFDRLDADVAVLKTDVAELKTDVAELKTDVAELKTDVAELKTDVAELKTDLAGFKVEVGVRFDRLEADAAETKQQLSRLEQAHQRHADRMDARFDQLIGLIVLDETKRPRTPAD